MEEKCLIKNLDKGTEVRATINPEQICFDKSVPWEQHKGSKGDNPLLQFVRAEPAMLSFELVFDTSKSETNAYEEHIRELQAMAFVNKGASNPEQKRPPQCLFKWGDEFPTFKGVIESISIKYTQFLPDGTPVRALCAVTMRQAGQVKAKIRRVRG